MRRQTVCVRLLCPCRQYRMTRGVNDLEYVPPGFDQREAANFAVFITFSSMCMGLLNSPRNHTNLYDGIISNKGTNYMEMEAELSHEYVTCSLRFSVGSPRPVLGHGAANSCSGAWNTHSRRCTQR